MISKVDGKLFEACANPKNPLHRHLQRRIVAPATHKDHPLVEPRKRGFTEPLHRGEPIHIDLLVPGYLRKHPFENLPSIVYNPEASPDSKVAVEYSDGGSCADMEEGPPQIDFEDPTADADDELYFNDELDGNHPDVTESKEHAGESKEGTGESMGDAKVIRWEDGPLCWKEYGVDDYPNLESIIHINYRYYIDREEFGEYSC